MLIKVMLMAFAILFKICFTYCVPFAIVSFGHLKFQASVDLSYNDCSIFQENMADLRLLHALRLNTARQN